MEGNIKDWRRCNRPSLPSIQAAGENLFATILCLEWDTNPHKPWRDEEERDAFGESFEAAIVSVSRQIPTAKDWYAAYFTLQGFRAVWVLSEALPVEDLQPKIYGFQEAFVKVGLPPDKNTGDWPRLFRLPRATRKELGAEAEILHDEVYYPVFNPNFVQGLNTDEIPSIIKPSSDKVAVSGVSTTIGEMPEEEECTALVWAETTKGVSDKRLTDWGKNVKAHLQGKPYFNSLFKDATLAQKGARDTTLYATIGSVVGILYHTDYVITPEHIFGLFYRAIRRMQDESTAAGESDNWLKTCWEQICRLSAIEDRKRELRQEEEKRLDEEKAVENLSKEELLIASMRKWCDHPDLWNSNREIQIKFIKRHLIAASGTGNQYYLLQPNGYYTYGEVSRDLVISRLKSLGMDFIVDLEYQTQMGVRKVPISDLLADNSTIVHSVRSEFTCSGGMIRLIGTDEATLIKPMFRTNPKLIPTYHDGVHKWLLSFKSEKLLDWLALCTDYEKRLVMLSIAGPGSIGKSLLLQGVVECLENPIRATAKDLAGRFSPNLTKTPFAVVDEGFIENDTTGGKEISATIREFIGGGEMESEKKHINPTGIVTNGRVMVMANNADVCAKLCGAGRNQTKEDLEAIEMRIFHLDVTDLAPREYLATVKVDSEEEGKWVHGKNLAKDYCIAKHILWLKENRKVAPAKNKRFAMDGKLPESIKSAMEKRTPNVDACVEAIISMIERPQPKEVADYIVVDSVKQSVFVVASSVLKAYEALGRRGLDRDMNTNRIGSALAWLRKDGAPNNKSYAIKKADGSKTPVQRWSEITFERLLRGAVDFGFPATKLKKLYTGNMFADEGE